MRLGLFNREDSVMLERDYFIDDTNNGWINGVPARVANTQMNDLMREQELSRILQQQGYQQPKNILEALQMMFNSGRLRQPQRLTRQNFPYAMGF